MSSGTITVRRPRVRNLEERFESRVLPLFAKRTREVDGRIPELDLDGLAEGDFDLALRGLLGEEAPLSASTVARLKANRQAEDDEWRRRRLDGLELTNLGGRPLRESRLEKDKAGVLVAIGGRSDGGKAALAVMPGQRESTESWSAMLRDLKARGLVCPRLAVVEVTWASGGAPQRLPGSFGAAVLDHGTSTCSKRSRSDSMERPEPPPA